MREADSFDGIEDSALAWEARIEAHVEQQRRAEDELDAAISAELERRRDIDLIRAGQGLAPMRHPHRLRINAQSRVARVVDVSFCEDDPNRLPVLPSTEGMLAGEGVAGSSRPSPDPADHDATGPASTCGPSMCSLTVPKKVE